MGNKDINGRSNDNKPFSERHPVLNTMIGLVLIILIIFGAVWLIRYLFVIIATGVSNFVAFLKKFVSTTDKVIVVAMITSTVSIVSVLFSSVIAKILDYRYNVKKYLYDKREVPYKQFIDMVYAIMDHSKSKNSQMSDEEIIKRVSEFSKELTLWGSNRVVKKWLKYRKATMGEVDTNNLFLMEDIIYEIRRDVGQRTRLKKGDMLSFFINDVEQLVNKK